ncbi:MAG TPA: hypothetical protein DDZ88_19385 [Verrucomicrobiales bacterium]|nr:hypothetical protein [Verrucomicrobiales bacterium]
MIGTVALFGLWAVPTYINISRMGNETWGVSYCKQILLGMKQFSTDNEGLYPDGGPAAVGQTSANQVFRRLFQAGVFTEETVFGCPGSRFVADGRIGSPPNYQQALESGECHWILLKHQGESSPGIAPVIVENALDSNWPPRWDVSDQAGNRKGRAREGRRIVIACNDGSAQMVTLREDGSLNAELWNRIFTPEQIAKLAYWDIEEK